MKCLQRLRKDTVKSSVSNLDSRREAKDTTEVDDAIIASIAAGTEKYVAQKRTSPFEEHFT